VTPAEPIQTSGWATIFQCRTPEEAALVADQLEAADIVPLLPLTLPENLEDHVIPVQVSTRALPANDELRASLGFRYEQHCAQQGLPFLMKAIAFCLPGLFLFGFLFFAIEAQRYRREGFERKAQQWARWFAYGLIGWIIAGLAVMWQVRQGR
jgi:hypothetical protein